MSLAVKKDSIRRSALLTNFGPSNFVTALDNNISIQSRCAFILAPILAKYIVNNASLFSQNFRLICGFQVEFKFKHAKLDDYK